VDSPSAFAIPLAFNDAIVALMGGESVRDMILLLDEFDTVLTSLDERVFLNLRALKDRYGEQLNYVMATVQPLTTAGGGDDLAEFLELFAASTLPQPLSNDEALNSRRIFRQANDSLIRGARFHPAQAGGHQG
jgi:hypothetical protein